MHHIIPTFRTMWLICSYIITFQFITKLPLSVWNPSLKEWNHEGLRKWEENVKAHLRLNRGIRVVGLARFRRSDFLTVTTAFTSMSVELWCFRFKGLSYDWFINYYFAHYSPVHKCWPKTSSAGNQGTHQSFDPSLLPKNLWLIVMGLSKFFIFLKKKFPK